MLISSPVFFMYMCTCTRMLYKLKHVRVSILVFWYLQSRSFACSQVAGLILWKLHEILQVFCLQHRSYGAHQCPNANQNDVTVLICPLCAKGVRLILNQDPNITWDIHVNSDCDPSNYERATKKKRCPVPGCKELLTFSNKIICRDCTQEHCLKHRFGPDHKCPGPAIPDSGFLFRGLLSNTSRRGMPSSAHPNSLASSSSSSWWSSSLLSAASSLRAAAESGMQRLRIGDDPVEKVHNKGSSQRQRVTVDVCPKCSRAFRDPVSLVQHVEKEHRGSSKA